MRASSKHWGVLVAGMQTLSAFCQEPMVIDETCTVTIGNQTAPVRPGGSFIVPNIAVFRSRDTGVAPQLYRVRATCIRDGVATTGQSEYFELTPGQTVFVGDVFPTEFDPIPVRIDVSAEAEFVPLGGTVQLTVMATLPGGSIEDITTRADGTTYLSTNPNLLSVDENGLVTGRNNATSPRNGMIAVLNEGSIATIMFTAVGPSNDFDNDGLPNDYEDLFGLNKFSNDANSDLDNDGLTNQREFQLGTIPNNPDTDGDGIVDGQDGDPLHPEEGPPLLTILWPPDGSTVVEGQTIEFLVDAQDDGLLTEVVLITDTGLIESFLKPPFKMNVNVQSGIADITFTAVATDSVGNETMKSATLMVIPDPLTTITGMVVDLDGFPVDGAVVTVIGVGLSVATDNNGAFSILDVPTVQGDFRLRAQSSGITTVTERMGFNLGGVTDVGVIVLEEVRTSSGFEFVVAFQPNANIPVLTLFLSSEDFANGQVEVPGIGFVQTFSIEPSITTSVVIPNAAIVNVSDGVENHGIRITADAPVTVYGLNKAAFTTDAFAGLPISTLGSNYRIMTYSGSPQLAVVATEDNTVVEVTPSVAVGARAAGVTYEVSLNALQVYQLTGRTDLTGTQIIASKPVAVFGGARCVNVPPGFFACDHLVEQIPPVDTWGQSVITVPLATRFNGDTFRILANEEETIVNILGQDPETLVLNKGQFAERILRGVNRITANQPVLVAQFSNGSQFDNVTGDPFMMLLPTSEQFLNQYTFATTGSGIEFHFVNIVAETPDAQAGNVFLDGVPIQASDFVPVPATPFSVATKGITAGSHTMFSSSPFGIYVYGFGNFDSYGYPGGFGLERRRGE